MAIYSEYHVEFNGHSLMNRNDPQQVEIFGPGSLKNRYVIAVAQFTSILSLRALILILFLYKKNPMESTIILMAGRPGPVSKAFSSDALGFRFVMLRAIPLFCQTF